MISGLPAAFSQVWLILLIMQTPHVFIDTSIIIGQNYDYDSTAFRQLISMAEEEKLFIYLSRVTVNEVEFHIAEDVVKAKLAFDGFRVKPDIRILKNIGGAPLYGVFNGFDDSQAKEILINQFRAFLLRAKAHVLEITDVSADDVFQRYFSRTPPFGNKKKHEFPDAFTLAAIELWCKESTGKMFVISSDPDWHEACSLNPSLRSVQSLSEFLDLLSAGERLAELVNKLFEQDKELILQKIKEGVDPLNLTYEPYGELQSSFVDSARIVKHYLIEVDEAKAIFEVITEVSYSANVLYRNYALRMMGSSGMREETEYGSTNVRAEVTIAFDEGNLDKLIVEAVNVKHDNVYVYPDEDPEDFARKFTKAQRSLEEHVVVIAEQLGGVKWVLANTPEAIIKRFDEVRQAMPVKLMLDLQTLNMLNSVTGGLSYHGATAIKDRTSSRNVSARGGGLRNAFASDLTAVSRSAFDAARMLKTSGIMQTMYNTQRSNLSTIHRAMDDAKLLSRSGIYGALGNAGLFDQTAVQQAIEMSKYSYRSSLSGQSFSRNMLLNIEPKSTAQLEKGEEASIRVEVLGNTDVYGESVVENEKNDEEDSIQTAAFEFNESPLIVTLNHGAGRQKPATTEHKLRRPWTERWVTWGEELERSIRYLSKEEIAAELGEDNDIADAATVSAPSYSEWKANEGLYDELVLEVAGFKLDDNDEFPSDQFRALPSKRTKDIRFEIKSSVIRKLYRCHCELERRRVSNMGEQCVYQYLEFNTSSFNVRHVFREPSAEESKEFRTTIVNGSFSTDEENREIINLQLNLATAVSFYDRLLIRVEKGTVDGRPYDDATRGSFLQAINPVYKLRVLEPLFDVNAWYFTIDDFTIP